MNQHLPIHVHSAHSYDATGWLLAAVIGWFLFTYVLQLGAGGAFGTFILNLISWLVMIDIIAMMDGLVARLPRPPEAQTIFLFVVLPYLLSGLSIYWLVKHPRPRKPPRGWREKLALRIHVSIRRWSRRRKSSPALL